MNFSSLRQLKYLVRNKPYKLEKPVVLQFPVIDICNSQCQMCRIWENKKSDDITVNELRNGLRNPLYSEVASVGLNGGEPTLRKDLGDLANVLFEELPKLRTISLITNAYKYEEVIERIIDVGNVAKKHNGMLDVMVSLDGYGEVHDRVRGKPGNFERAQKVIGFTQSSPLVASVRIGCTIIKENVYGLADLFEYCQSKGLYIKYRLGIPHQRLYTQNLLDPYALTEEEKYHIVEFLEGLIAHYETKEHQKFFYRSLIDQLVLNAPRKAGCDWQHRGATITSKGELLYCAVQSKVLGKIQEGESENIYFRNQAHLISIQATKCASCNHDYVGIPPKKQYFKQLAIQALRKFQLEPLVRDIYRFSYLSAFRNYRLFNARQTRMKNLARESLPPSTPRAGDAAKNILICGWYGTETLGDKAILGGVLQALRSHLSDINVVLVSLYPYVSEMTRRQMSELKGVRIVTCEEGVKLAAQSDLVIFGGGPLMAINDTADMLAIFESAKRANRKTLIAGCGVGPMGKSWHNRAITKILQSADARIYRDESSRDNAAKLGVDVQNDLVAEDPAFTWLATQRQQLIQTRRNSTPKVLILGLRDFPYRTYATHLSETACLEAKERYENAIIEALSLLIEQNPKVIIRPIPMCTNHFGDDDRWFYRRLFRGVSKLEPNLDLSLLGRELSPIDYCDAFKQGTVAITMRFHSVVFALGLGIPTVAIDYTLGRGKVQAVAEFFGVPYKNLVEIDSKFLVSEVSNLFRAQRVQESACIYKFTDAMQSKLNFLGIKNQYH